MSDDSAVAIEVLGFPDVVRRRVGMYFPFHEEPPWNVLVREALCHAVEELIFGRATFARVVIGDSLIVEDDGLGLIDDAEDDRPSQLERVMTLLHAGCRREHLIQRVQEEICGASMAAVNAVSSAMAVDSILGGRHWHIDYEAGVPVSPVRCHDTRERDGLRFTFKPDRAIVPEKFDRDAFLNWWNSLDFPIDKAALRLE